MSRRNGRLTHAFLFFLVLGGMTWGGLAVNQTFKKRVPVQPEAQDQRLALEVSAAATDSDSASSYLVIPVSPGTRFELSYVHSVEKVPVRGIFRIKGLGKIAVEASASTSFGAGLPYEKDIGQWRFQDGWMTVSELNTELEELPVIVSPDTRQTLTVGSQDYPLEAFYPVGSSVAIRVVSISD